MSASDAMIRRFEQEFEERQAFIQGLIAGAEDKGRDLSEQELKLIAGARDRMKELADQLEPLRATADIAAQSRQKAREIDEAINTARTGQLVGKVEYRSAGAYLADLYAAAMNGGEDARNRLEVFNRTAAHQTLADNPGLLPESIVEPVINLVDNARPAVTALGPTDLGSGSWAYAKITQHTQVGVQSAEKAEMASRKMTITKTPITAPTYGGYVNISKQDISRTSPQITDMVIADLASEYATETEKACVAALLAGATAGTALDATPTAAEIATALWNAAATVYSSMKGAGQLLLLVAPGDMGLFGPLFAPVNPQNGFSSGFAAGSFGSGAMGAISGITTIMTPGFAAAGQALVVNSRCVRVFEHRYGALQVDEPSVWGLQVGYAGDFQTVIVQTGGIVSIDTVP
jgi:HK97 family phage major capsid protein